MSRRSAALVVMSFAFVAAPQARAQQEDAPSAEDLISHQRDDLQTQLDQPEECATDEMQPDIIVVCRDISGEEEATARAMLPIRPQVQSDRIMMPGLNDPPCWISKKPGVFCARLGRARPPAQMVDLDSIPEALTPEEAALVFRAEDLPPTSPEQEAEVLPAD